MYVNNIELKNIRGFENLEFSLARPDGSYAGWTVLNGDNGFGKSSLLVNKMKDIFTIQWSMI